jgi:hypothetical protein
LVIFCSEEAILKKNSFVACLLGAALVVAAPAIASASVLTLNSSNSTLDDGAVIVATISGGSILGAPVSGIAAEPPGTTGNFLAAGPNDNGDALLTFTQPVNSVTFIWGSPDLYNTLVINGVDYFASNFGINPADGNQSQGPVVSLSGFGPITTLGFLSGSNAFEVSNFQVNAVPEASTWAMMVLGFLGLGFLGYRKSSSTGSAFRVA